MKGADLDKLRKIFLESGGKPEEFDRELDKCIEQGLVAVKEGKAFLTTRGLEALAKLLQDPQNMALLIGMLLDKVVYYPDPIERAKKLLRFLALLIGLAENYGHETVVEALDIIYHGIEKKYG